MEDLINIKEPLDTTDFTFIMPSVSVGNVGQLTVDLLIASYDFKKLATIWDPAIIPSVGADPFTGDSTEVCTACELYVNEQLKIVVMQLRSSIEYKLALKFFNRLKQCIIALKFKEVIVLTSSFAYELHNISSSHFRYITNNSNFEEILKNLNVTPMEAAANGRYIIYGAGFASKLYELFSDSLKTTVVVKYSSEGDNRPDALQMLNILNGVIESLSNINEKGVKFPFSWQFVFGNPPPIGIY